jgi:hypothetical protein
LFDPLPSGVIGSPGGVAGIVDTTTGPGGEAVVGGSITGGLITGGVGAGGLLVAAAGPIIATTGSDGGVVVRSGELIGIIGLLAVEFGLWFVVGLDNGPPPLLPTWPPLDGGLLACPTNSPEGIVGTKLGKRAGGGVTLLCAATTNDENPVGALAVVTS